VVEYYVGKNLLLSVIYKFHVINGDFKKIVLLIVACISHVVSKLLTLKNTESDNSLQDHDAEFCSRVFFGKMIETETLVLVVVIKIPQVLIYFSLIFIYLRSEAAKNCTAYCVQL
jgi:hypothetical protein